MRAFWPFHLFGLRRHKRRNAEVMAAAAIELFGADAYEVARICSGPAGARKDRFWATVAVRIADRTGREIGVTGADRRRGH